MDYRSAVETVLASVPDTEIVYLFGSHARGDAHPGSDVDLALLSDSRLAVMARFELQERIAARLGVSVDLVDLRAASTVMRIQVIEHGIVLYERSPARREAFEACALSAYARLNEERRGILDDIRQTGTVHG